MIPVLIPTGEPLSARWRRVLNLALIYAALFVSATSLQQHFETGSTRLENPFALLPLTDAEELLLPFAIPFLLLGALSTVARYRRSRGLVRQQLRWFVFAFMVTIVLFVINGVLDLALTIGDIPIVISLSAPAVAIGISVMRYRFFEIEDHQSDSHIWARNRDAGGRLCRDGVPAFNAHPKRRVARRRESNVESAAALFAPGAAPSSSARRQAFQPFELRRPCDHRGPFEPPPQ